MNRRQIHMPDELDNRLARLAASREWSYSEAIRRAVELFIAAHPNAGLEEKAWTLPSGRPLGLKDDIDWSALRFELESRLPVDDR